MIDKSKFFVSNTVFLWMRNGPNDGHPVAIGFLAEQHINFQAFLL